MNRSDEKTFKIIHKTIAHCGGEKSFLYFFFFSFFHYIISYQTKLCRSNIIKPNDVYMMNGQCFANSFIVISIWISWKQKVSISQRQDLPFDFWTFVISECPPLFSKQCLQAKYILLVGRYCLFCEKKTQSPVMTSLPYYGITSSMFFFLFFQYLRSIIFKWMNLQRVPIIISTKQNSMFNVFTKMYRRSHKSSLFEK